MGFIDTLKRTTDLPIADATSYFDLAVRLGNSTSADMSTDFKTMATADQEEFLDMIAEYQDALAMVADKETEYKLMISEKLSMLEKDRSMAHAEREAAEAAYKTVSNEIIGSAYIYAPRAGSLGDLPKGRRPRGTRNVGCGYCREYHERSDSAHAYSQQCSQTADGRHRFGCTPGHRECIPGTFDRRGFVAGCDGFLHGTHCFSIVSIGQSASVRVIASNDSSTPTVPLIGMVGCRWYAIRVARVGCAANLCAKISLGRTLGSSIGVWG